MPKRAAGEPLNEYISKFVSDKHEKKKFKNIKQRLAVAYSEGGEGKKKRA
jgi:hypothetical protein